MRKSGTSNQRLGNTISLKRRDFLRKAAFAAGGMAAIGQLAPNLIINPAYGGTVVIIDASGDKRVSISNGSFARPFDIGTWSEMRIGLRVAMNGSSSLTSLTPRFVIGLCSGNSNQVFDATTTNFVGTRSTLATWTWNDSTNDYFSLGAGSFYPTKRVDTTWTDGAQD